MISIMNDFINELNNNNRCFASKRFKDFFQEIKYFISPDLNIMKQNLELMNFIHKNKFFVIDYFNELDGDRETNYFILSFSNLYVFIIDYPSIPVIKFLISSCINPNIMFLRESKIYFDKLIHETQYNEIKLIPYFVQSIIKNFYSPPRNPKCKKFLRIITPSIIVSFFQFNRKISKSNEPYSHETISEKDYVSLQEIGHGCESICELVFNFKMKKFIALKRYCCNDPENKKLYTREIKNYSIFNHPLFPRFYGTSDSRRFGIFIEYIHGKTLFAIDKLIFDINDKITIIFELMIALEYLHNNGLVYRCLKPNDILIDQNKNIVIIDFDRLVSIDNCLHNKNMTVDFCSDFVAPEILCEGSFSYKNDIYSLGKIIHFIFYKESNENTSFNSIIKNIIFKCTKDQPEERPTIYQLITEFYQHFHDLISTDFIFSMCKYYSEYPQKAFFNNYHKSSSCINSDILIELGNRYYDGKSVVKDVNKSIFYFTEASNQNNSKAQFNLGMIYYEKKDIGKSIHYFTLAGNQKESKSLFNLGMIYYSGEYVERDINKAIYYLSEASNQNNSEAQFNLGCIYSSLLPNIDKAIHYYSLAANQNHVNAQFNLGTIYENIKHDIGHAISYYSLAADQNYSKAQVNLGNIYINGQYGFQDTGKGIHYLTMAANQKDPRAEYILRTFQPAAII